MHILGKYTINIVTKKVCLSDQVMPLFCRQDFNVPGLDAYFLNTVAYERATVEKQFFTALTKLSNFKIEHFIKLKGQMIKIQNTGKVFFDKTSNAKKMIGTIICMDYLNTASVNFTDEDTIPENYDKVEQQVFNVEDLLNRFVKKKRTFCKDDLKLYVKMDMHLPKLLNGDAYALTLRLQHLYDEVLQKHTTGEVILTTKLIQPPKENITVNFSVFLKNKSTSISKDFELSFKIASFKGGQSDTNTLNTQKPLQILLVEDHEMNQLIATNLLKREFENIQIDLAENGLVAFEKIQQNQYDLILMDINMPVLNGIEATQKIRAELGCSTPILALSAHDFPQQIQQCFSVGMNDFIAKPINTQILKRKIVKALLLKKNKMNQSAYRSLDYHSDVNGKKIAV